MLLKLKANTMWTPIINTNFLSPKFTPDQTDEMLKALAENDKATNAHLEYIREVLQAQRESGLENNPLEAKYDRILQSYSRRQDEIKNSRLVKIQGSIKKAVSWFRNMLGLGNINGLGGLPRVPPAVAMLFGLPGMALAIYQFFEPRYQDSTRDLKESKELKELLDKTDPATAQKIRDDLEGQIDDAFAAGKNRGMFGGVFGGVALIMVLATVIWLIAKVFPRVKKTITAHPIAAKTKKLIA